LTEPLPPLRKVFAAAFVGLIALVPVLWFYAEVDVARYWAEWDNGRRGGFIRIILFAPIILYAMLFGYLVRWLKRETKND
jgi:hypothetical protein